MSKRRKRKTKPHHLSEKWLRKARAILDPNGRLIGLTWVTNGHTLNKLNWRGKAIFGVKPFASPDEINDHGCSFGPENSYNIKTFTVQKMR